MGNAMAPATDAVMGAVPEANAGVGSALNDVTRNVGGALGVGIMGSIVNFIYSSDVAGLPATAGKVRKALPKARERFPFGRAIRCDRRPYRGCFFR